VILIDTSVWIDHFRAAEPRLVDALEDGRVACHPFVIGEVALGHLRRRAEVIALMSELPSVPVVEHPQVMAFIETHRLMATGIGWTDAHLLCAASRSGTVIWSGDRPLRRQASRLGLSLS
jgi:predicted nucleic acid-binding protein